MICDFVVVVVLLLRFIFCAMSVLKFEVTYPTWYTISNLKSNYFSNFDSRKNNVLHSKDC